MDIRFDDGAQFRQLAAKFRAAGNGSLVRKALTAAIQAELKPVVSDIQTAVRAVKVRTDRYPTSRRRRTSTPGRGSQRRQLFDAAKEARRIAKATAAGRKVRSRRSGTHTGLRERIAHSVKSKVSYSGFRMGAKVYIETSNFPGSQRKLPRYLNRSSGWRHPVWGHRNRWVTEHGAPYFDRPIEHHRDRIRRNVAAAVDKAVRTLQ